MNDGYLISWSELGKKESKRLTFYALDLPSSVAGMR
jgi:hypothetical protein